LDYQEEIIASDAKKDILDALVTGLKDYFRKSGFKKAVIGLSGGIDSALTLVIACKALGSENVLAILMPSPYSSKHSIDDSLVLCANVGCSHRIIKIHDLIEEFDNTLSPEFG